MPCGKLVRHAQQSLSLPAEGDASLLHELHALLAALLDLAAVERAPRGAESSHPALLGLELAAPEDRRCRSSNVDGIITAASAYAAISMLSSVVSGRQAITQNED